MYITEDKQGEIIVIPEEVYKEIRIGEYLAGYAQGKEDAINEMKKLLGV